MFRKSLNLIIDFFWYRRRELLDGAFWAHLLRAAREILACNARLDEGIPS
jgi:hypothetical protein